MSSTKSAKDDNDRKPLEHEEFFIKTKELLDKTNCTGVPTRVTVKRYVEDNERPDGVSVMSEFTKVKGEHVNKKPYRLLVRVKHTRECKAYTLVSADCLDKFWKDFSSTLKSELKGLEKKKKKKKSGKKV